MKPTVLQRTGGAFRFALLSLMIVGTLFPLYFMVITAFKSNAELGRNYFLPPLEGFQFENLWAGFEAVGPYVWNSIVVALGTTVILLVVVVPCVYAIAWIAFPAAPRIYSIAITTMLVPSVLIFVPQYILTRQLGLIDNQLGVILPFVASGIGISVFLLRSFFQALPFELIEAARIDGASELRILRGIVLPLTVPSLTTIAVIAIVTAWNAFLWPLVVISTGSKRLVSVAVTFLSNADVGLQVPALMAGYLVASLPLIVMLSVLMRFFIRGMTEGAVKG